MNSLSSDSSVWLDLLGHVALKGAGLLTVVLVLGLGLRRVSAARRYVLWLSAALAVSALTLAAPLLPAWRVLPAHEEQALELPEEVVVEAPVETEAPMPERMKVPLPQAVVPLDSTPVSSPTPLSSPKIDWQKQVRWLPLIWILIAIGWILRLFVSGFRLALLRRRCTEESPSLKLQAALAELADQKGMASPRLLIGPAGSVPMVWGILRPCLLLPSDAVDWSDAKLRAVLLHELAHLQRGDPAALLVAQTAQALHWFNPLAWLTVRRLRADQERACDDAVLQQGVRPSEYAQHLLDFSQNYRLEPGLGHCALAMARPSPVEGRLAAILDPRIRRETSSRSTVIGALLIAGSIALPLAMVANEVVNDLRGRIMDRNGVVLAESTKEKARHYPLKALAAHVVGYTGKSGPDDPTPIGRAAMEKQQDAALKQGKDVALSLDARIQSLATRAVKDSGFERAAVVVLDPRTGEILASVSLPNYDPNRFVPTLAKEVWDVYVKDKSLPMFDRCLQGQYSPGAAFIPFTALAGVSAGVGERQFDCTGSVDYNGKTFRCWIASQNKPGHGTLDVSSAIVASCNCYWYQFGNAAGPDAFVKMGHRIGIGEATGVIEHEAKGELPSPAWLAARSGSKDKWTPGQMAYLAIGQGRLLTTPLQLAVLAATIGNGGKVPKATLLRLERGAKPEGRSDLVADGLPAGQIENIREGMRLVVNSEGGTGKAARSDRVVIAGKTGTSQFWRRVDGKQEQDNRALFMGFAPFEKPTLAFAVLVESGMSGGRDAAPIAKRIVEETLALPADGSGKVEPLEEQTGHFKPIDSTAAALGKTEPSAAGGVSASSSAEEPRHPLMPHKRDLIEEARQASNEDVEWVNEVRPIDKGRYVESDPVQEKIKSMNPAHSDEAPKILTPNSDDAAFFKSFQSEPRRFVGQINRTHYFDDDVPDLEKRDCFEVEPANDTTRHYTFVLKSSSLGKDLKKRIPWSADQDLALPYEVELKWNKDGGKEWLELVSVEGYKPETKAKKKASPSDSTSPPATSPSLPNAPWKMIQIDGRDHVNLENVKSFYRFSSLDRSEDNISLRAANMMIETRLGSRELIVNGVKYLLSFPIAEEGGQACISRQDLVTILEPVLRPSGIKDAVDFDTVVIDPGHGGADEGAKGLIGLEKTFTLELGMELKKELISRGIKVVMTRETDSFVPSVRRVAIANQTPKSIVLSLHFNSGAGNADGIETFALASKEGVPLGLTSQNIALATAIHAKVKSQFGLHDRGIKSAQWTVLTGLKQPGILFEGGFVTNESEGRLIASDTYRKAMAGAMAEAVINYKKALSVTNSRETK